MAATSTEAKNTPSTRSSGTVRGTGRGSDADQTAAKRRRAALATMIRNSLRGADGLRVLASGELAEANSHSRGTAWVEIEADSVLDCDLAEYRLSCLAEIKPAAWANGWTLAENQQRETSLRLRLYASR